MSPLGASPSDSVEIATDLLGPWFRTLARSVQTGVVLVDAAGEPVFANDAAGELLGLSASGSPSLQGLKSLIPPKLREACTEESELLEVEVAPPSGKRRILLKAIPLDDGECGSLILVEDGTRMAALEASLVLAGRMQNTTTLRSLAHDLRAPLNALSLNLELLRKSLEDEEGKARDVREMQITSTDVLQREIQRLARSLEFFLRQAVQPGRSERVPRRVDVRRPIREVLRLVRPGAKSAGVRLRSELPKTSLGVFVHDDSLKQALLNLVLNALEAQPEGGEIRLRAERREGRVRISVEDDGPGIPEVLLAKVLEMNFTTKADGNGIGLTVAKSLVDSQQGTLILKSRPGEGTTVEVHFPEAGN